MSRSTRYTDSIKPALAQWCLVLVSLPQVIIKQNMPLNDNACGIVECSVKAKDHSVHASGFRCTPVASVISVVLPGYRFVPLFIYSGLLL